MSALKNRIALLSLAALAAGCGPSSPGLDAGAGFPADAFLTLTGDSGRVHLALRSSPKQPPARGVSVVRFTLTDGAGEPLDGLTLAVTPFMPSMGHGTSVQPTITAAGEGNYDVSNLYMPMPGHWELRATVSGAVDDSATPSFDVP